ncbi:MAG: dephospho-CoA kinase [Bacteroidaceae bacterium]|nr:dephospho-CoA kinase [Bacteroidaceae bacterium]
MLQKKRLSLGITGGIGSGKSYVCRILERLQIPVFYTDEEARCEMLSNPQIHSQLFHLLQADVLLPTGELNKPLISTFIRSGEDAATAVNAIVHPQVRIRFRRWMAQQEAPLVAMESALLFESGFQSEVDWSVLVTAPEEVRIARVMARDGKSREEVLRWMALQMSEERKAELSSFVVLNNGKHDVEVQIRKLTSRLMAQIAAEE